MVFRGLSWDCFSRENLCGKGGGGIKLISELVCMHTLVKSEPTGGTPRSFA